MRLDTLMYETNVTLYSYGIKPSTSIQYTYKRTVHDGRMQCYFIFLIPGFLTLIRWSSLPHISRTSFIVHLQDVANALKTSRDKIL